MYKESGVSMKELELLGLQNDGEHLTLNDAEGNRYSLEITGELRTLVRKEHVPQPSVDEPTPSISPREIQAYVRAGKTVEEISELASIERSQVESLAHPIINERNYTARLARSLPTSRAPGSLSLEELVATRLASRGVNIDDIQWDAIRKSGEPWTVIARYESAERERQAVWHVDVAKRSLQAVSEEAVWLSETPILPHNTWRAPNTPPLQAEPSASASVSSLPSAPSTPSASTPDAEPSKEPASISRIDAVLADLNSRRGIPTDDAHYSSLIEAEAARALQSANSPDKATAGTPSDDTDGEENRETIFDLPVRATGTKNSENTDTAKASTQDDDLFSAADEDNPRTEQDTSSQSSQSSQSGTQKKVRRSDRPSMPSWDEIVFGKKD
ncbi:MAG: DUF3071 domain-containing protein [Actinomycetaceae bacterium]|nr:DUF3071 domain-containing protein [Actinomycetaceae bacterium]